MTILGWQSTSDEVLEGIDLAGKRALVTGVSAGLGVETARALAAHGAEVIGTARDWEKAHAATARIRDAYGGRFSLVKLDRTFLGHGCRDRPDGQRHRAPDSRARPGERRRLGRKRRAGCVRGAVAIRQRPGARPSLSEAAALTRTPEKLSAGLQLFFRVQGLETMLTSIEDAARRYQNPQVAQTLAATFAESGANRERFRSYLINLAADRERQFEIMDQEAQRCRGMLMSPPPKTTVRKK